MSTDGWYRVEPVDVPDEGRVRSVTVGGRTVALVRAVVLQRPEAPPAPR